MLVTKQFW